MKKIIFTILLSIVATSFYAQRNNLLEDGRRWVTTAGIFYINAEDIDSEYIKTQISWNGGYYPINNITINGDTTINDTIYKKLYFKRIVDTNIYPDWKTSGDIEGHIKETNNYTDWNILGNLEGLIRYENGKYLYRFLNEHVGLEYKKGYPYDFFGNEYLLFDENLAVGDTIALVIVSEISDTIDTQYSDYPLKYWKVKDSNSGMNYYATFEYFNDIEWIQGVGRPTTLLPYQGRGLDCLCDDALLFCIAANGDTIYRNKQYWYPELAMTTIGKISAAQVSFKQQGGECIVTLPGEVAAWSATLSNSNGITVARRSGEGSEIILPATSKGTHILVVKADGKVVKKKVFIK